jgi:hypothetical protein
MSGFMGSCGRLPRSGQQKNVVKKDLHGAIMALGHYFIF